MLDGFEITPARLTDFAVLLLSISFHESAHAYVASWRGDPTPALTGRKTLNPIRHLDPIMSVLLPGFIIFTGQPWIFGAGRPVRVSPMLMKVPDRDNALVAIAGPASNALLVILTTAGLLWGLESGWATSGDPNAGGAALAGHALRRAIFINLLLMVFNLIPVPPLDGSRLVGYLLPSSLKPLWFRLDLIGFMVLIVMLFTGVLGSIFGAVFQPLWAFWTNLYTGMI